MKYPNTHSLDKFSRAYEIVLHSCPQAYLFHFAFKRRLHSLPPPNTKTAEFGARPLGMAEEEKLMGQK